MRIAFFLSTVVLFALVVACSSGKHVVVTKSGLSCSPQPTPSPRAASGRRPTPEPTLPDSVYADFGAALSKYYQSKYHARYDFCAVASDDGSTATGSVEWFKDAATRFRVDEHTSVNGKRSTRSQIAVMGDTEPRLAECSNDLGGYYRVVFGAEEGQGFLQAYPELKGYLTLGATCLNKELNTDEDLLTQAQLYALSPVELKNFNESPRIYAQNLSEVTETIAGREVICFRYGDFGADHKNCFDGGGVLVASGGGAVAMQLTELNQSVSDSDFVPPYAVVASPEQCPGNTAWDRATPTNPGASAVAPSPGAYHDALTKYFNVRSKVSYEMCYHGGDGNPRTFVGPLIWIKDGTARARFDLTEEGGPRTSYVVSRSDQTVCTADASNYLRDHAGGDQLKRPFNQSLLKLTEACFPDSEGLGGNSGYEYETYVLNRVFVAPNALKINLADWEQTDPLFNGKTYQRTVAGGTATCYTHLYDREECYTDDGILVFARDGVHSSLEATSVSTDVSDADFQLPYDLKQTPP